MAERGYSTSPVTLEVLNPTGAWETSQFGAPRLNDLHGKTICLLWNGLFRGSEIPPIIQELLEARFPGVRVVPYTEFSTTSAHSGDVDNIAREMKEKGCDALIHTTGA